jgi:site-specific DNA-methyltransferase (adenine-specific)
VAKRRPPRLLTIKQAAEILNVAEVTLRRWDASGKFKARRHPMNNYRVYPERDVLRLRERIWSGKAA